MIQFVQFLLLFFCLLVSVRIVLIQSSFRDRSFLFEVLVSFEHMYIALFFFLVPLFDNYSSVD